MILFSEFHQPLSATGEWEGFRKWGESEDLPYSIVDFNAFGEKAWNVNMSIHFIVSFFFSIGVLKINEAKIADIDPDEF